MYIYAFTLSLISMIHVLEYSPVKTFAAGRNFQIRQKSLEVRFVYVAQLLVFLS